jgi:penicillin-binding protein 1A
MTFLVYAAVLIVTVFSVVLEWDALVEPSAATRHAMHSVTQLHRVQPAPQPSAAPAQHAVHAASPVPAKPAPTQTAEPAPPAAPPQCDVAACAAAYVSFRAEDCTWQPYEGPRRLCTKGAADTATAAANADANVPGVIRCHRRACAEAYSSFNPTDCTYQPLDGPRRLCEK